MWFLCVTQTRTFYGMMLLKIDPWSSILALGPPEFNRIYHRGGGTGGMMQSLNFEGSPVHLWRGNISKATLPVWPGGSYIVLDSDL